MRSSSTWGRKRKLAALDREHSQENSRPVEQPNEMAIDAEFARQLAEFIEQYRSALEALAESE